MSKAEEAEQRCAPRYHGNGIAPHGTLGWTLTTAWPLVAAWAVAIGATAALKANPP